MTEEIDQAEPSGQDYVPDTQDEKRRMFALAVVVQQSEPTRVSPEEFVTMAHRVDARQALASGLAVQCTGQNVGVAPGRRRRRHFGTASIRSAISPAQAA